MTIYRHETALIPIYIMVQFAPLIEIWKIFTSGFDIRDKDSVITFDTWQLQMSNINRSLAGMWPVPVSIFNVMVVITTVQEVMVSSQQ